MLELPVPPIRVLQVTAGLNRAGVETWLVQILRAIDRERFQLDFLVHGLTPYDYESEATALGARVIRCLHPARPWLYAPAFRRILQTYGPYQAVHSHLHHFSAIPLAVAAAAGVPVRIAHTHSTQDGRGFTPARAAYRIAAQLLTRRAATHLLGVSRQALESLFGARCWSDPRVQVWANGFDFGPFTSAPLTPPSSTLRLVHVGRFEPPKNHAFLIELFAQLLRVHPAARLTLIGDGTLRPAIERQLNGLGLTAKVRLLGVRADIPELLPQFDALVFPSLYEGMPLAVLEAQAAGLPCVLSTAIPAEADIGLGLTSFLNLHDPVPTWIEAVLNARHTPRPDAQTRTRALQQSGFDICDCANRLQTLWASGPKKNVTLE